MILTGSEIIKEYKNGHLTIEPFDKDLINPNSYNYRLGDQLQIFLGVKDNKQLFEEITIPESGYILKPHQMYLGHTFEVLGSNKYASWLIGRSSLGRLGLFLQISANLGHTGAAHSWTLEIVCTIPFIIYPRMKIGQISFWENYGDVDSYKGVYAQFNTPKTSMLNSD